MSTANQVTHEDALNLAKRYHLNGQLDLAARVYQDILKVVPEDPTSLHYMAVLSYQTEDFENGIEYIEKALGVKKDFPDSWNVYGIFLANKGEKKLAIEKWEKAIALKSDFADAYTNIGNAYWELKDFENAEINCRKALNIDPENPGYLINLGNALASQHQQKDAIKLWEKAFDLNPADANALINMGNAYKELGEIKKSLEICEKAYEMAPLNTNALLNLGNAKRAIGLPKEAEALYRTATQLMPNLAKAHYNLSLALIDQFRYDEAAISLRYAITFEPNNENALANLAFILSETNELAEAEKIARKVLKLHPDSAEAHIDLSEILFKLEKFDDAEVLLDQAAELGEESSSLYMKRANVLERLNRIDEALDSIEKATELTPETPEIIHRKATIQYMAGKTEEALETLEALFEINPNYAHAIATKSEIMQSYGKQEEALKLARRALSIAPNIPHFYFSLSKLKKFTENDPDLLQMESMVKGLHSHGAAQAIGLNFALFKAYEDLKQYDKAFDHLKTGADLKFKTLPFRPEVQKLNFQKTKDNWNAERLEKYKEFGNQDKTPIFIVGMPRSGTTLTEQIISSHPEVFGAGELYYLAAAEKDAGIITPETTKIIGEEYIEMARGISDEARAAKFITDKMPSNFSKVGLISAALPNAKIIHTRRNPMDTCLSCYKQLFARGHDWSYELEAMAEHYELYMDLMAHWRENLPGKILEINYEDTVENFENQARKLIDFVGLEWDDACLSPHKQKRAILTASKGQVSKPIYKTSVQGWKRYEEQLQPLAQPLQKFVTNDGRQKVD